jgi:hypothetical protein
MGVLKHITDPAISYPRPNLMKYEWVNPSKKMRKGKSVLGFFGPREIAVVLSTDETGHDSNCLLKRAYEPIEPETGCLYLENRKISLGSYLFGGNSGEFYACSEKDEDVLARLDRYIFVCENLAEINFVSSKDKKAEWLSKMPLFPELELIKESLPKMFTEFDTIVLDSYEPSQRLVSVKLSGLNKGGEELVERASEKLITELSRYDDGAALHDNAFFYSASLYRFGRAYGKPAGITEHIRKNFFSQRK